MQKLVLLLFFLLGTAASIDVFKLPIIKGSPECNINAKCKGSPVLSYTFTNNKDECLYQCKHYFPPSYQPDCQWITFDPDTGLCELLEHCSSTGVEGCSNCISSKAWCDAESDPVCYVQGNCQV